MPARSHLTRRAEKAREVQQEQSLQVWSRATTVFPNTHKQFSCRSWRKRSRLVNAPGLELGLSSKGRGREKQKRRPLLLSQGVEGPRQSKLLYPFQLEVRCRPRPISVYHDSRRQFKLQINKLGTGGTAKQRKGRTRKHPMREESGRFQNSNREQKWSTKSPQDSQEFHRHG